MKKIIAVALAAVALNASAFTGNGNLHIDRARDYLAVVENGNRGNNEQVLNQAMWLGTISGLTSVFTQFNYKYSICYPENATNGQMAEIAANYLIENPEIRAESLDYIVWFSHMKTFGFDSDADCYRHDLWVEHQAKYNS